MNKRQDILYYIDQVLEGNTNAFSHIVDRHKDRAFNLAFRICCNREEAEEIAQDSFLKAYRALGSFQRKSSFATWLYRIVYNTAISSVRLKKKEVLSLEDFPADATDFISTGTSEEEAEAEYRKSLIDFAFMKISEEERSLITLHYYEELSTDEIADITGISKSNVKVKLFRARQKMMQVIGNSEKKERHPMNIQEENNDKLLREYLSPKAKEKAPAGFTAGIMNIVSLEARPVRQRKNFLSTYKVPLVTISVALILMAAAMLLSAPDGNLPDANWMKLIRPLAMPAFKIDLDNLVRLNLPAYLPWLFLSFLFLTLFDRGLNVFFHRGK